MCPGTWESSLEEYGGAKPPVSQKIDWALPQSPSGPAWPGMDSLAKRDSGLTFGLFKGISKNLKK